MKETMKKFGAWLMAAALALVGMSGIADEVQQPTQTADWFSAGFDGTDRQWTIPTDAAEFKSGKIVIDTAADEDVVYTPVAIEKSSDKVTVKTIVEMTPLKALPEASSLDGAQAAFTVLKEGEGLAYYGLAKGNDAAKWVKLTGATPVEDAEATVSIEFDYSSAKTVTYKVGETALSDGTTTALPLADATKTTVTSIAYTGSGVASLLVGDYLDADRLFAVANAQAAGGYDYYATELAAQNAAGEGNKYLAFNASGAWDEKTAPHFVACIGEVKYATLQAAVNAAAEGKTVKMLDNVEECVVVAEGKDITLDLNGKMIDAKNVPQGSALKNLGKVTVTDSSDGKTGILARNDLGGDNVWYVISNEGEMVIDYANVTNLCDKAIGPEHASLIQNVDGGKMTINDGFFQQPYTVVKNEPGGDLTINGGTFSLAGSSQYDCEIQCYGNVAINGGTFDATLQYEKDATLVIAGGTFVVDPKNFIKDGCSEIIDSGAKTTYTVVTEPPTDASAWLIGGFDLPRYWRGGAAAANKAVSAWKADANDKSEILHLAVAPTTLKSVSGENVYHVIYENDVTPGSGVTVGMGYELKSSYDDSTKVYTYSAEMTPDSACACIVKDDAEDVYYPTLKSAISAAVANDTIKVLKDDLENASFFSGITATPLTLDLNGKTIGSTAQSSYKTISVTKSITLTIVDGEGVGIVNQGVYVQDANATVVIKGGVYKGELHGGESYYKGTIKVQGGTFYKDPTAFVDTENYEVIENPTEPKTWTVQEKVPVAQIDGTKYYTLAEAVDAANAMDANPIMIKLLCDIEVTETLEINNVSKKAVTFNANGRHITAKTTMFNVKTTLAFNGNQSTTPPQPLAVVECPEEDAIFTVETGVTFNIQDAMFSKDVSGLIDQRRKACVKNDKDYYEVVALKDQTARELGYVVRNRADEEGEPYYYKSLANLIADGMTQFGLIVDVSEDIKVAGKGFTVYAGDYEYTGSVKLDAGKWFTLMSGAANLTELKCDDVTVGDYYSDTKCTLTIAGGSVAKVTIYREGYLNIIGGTFGFDPRTVTHVTIPEGYDVINNGNGTWTVQAKATAVAEVFVGEESKGTYETVQAAIAAVTEDGSTVKLLTDVELDAALNGGTHSITIDGDGHKFTQKAGVSPYHWFCFGTQQSPSGAGKEFTFKNATIDGFTSGTYMFRVEECAMTIDNVTFNECEGTYIALFTHADATILNSVFTNNKASKIIDFNSNASDGDDIGIMTIANTLFDGNEVSDTGLIYIAKESNGSGSTITDCTFEGNVCKAASAASMVYLSQKADIANTLFKDNVVTSTSGTEGKVGVICLGSGAANAVITENAFDGNAVTAQEGQATGTVFAGASGVNLSANYWDDGAAPERGDGKDIYTTKTGIIADTYATGYTLNEDNYGVTVTLPSPYWSDHAAAAYSTPVDTDNKILTIATPEELALFAKEINENTAYYLGYTISISADLDLSAYKWVPIKTKTMDPVTLLNYYALNNATIDGNGHSIKGLNFDYGTAGDTSENAFIGIAKGYGLTIKDLTFDGADVTNPAQTAVILGQCYHPATFDGVSVINSTIAANKKGTAFLAQTGGESEASPWVFKDCVCSNVSVSATSARSAFFVALVNVNNAATFENCRIYNDCTFDGSHAFINESSNASVCPTLDATAEVGGWWYPSIGEAFDAAEVDDEVKLLVDSAENAEIPVGVTFDTNGKSYTGTLTAPKGYKLKDLGNGKWGVEEAKTYVAEIFVDGESKGTYETLDAAIKAAAAMDPEELKDIELQSCEITENIKLPATLKNVTFYGHQTDSDNDGEPEYDGTSVLKNMTINSSDGSAYTYESVAFIGVVFDNSRIVVTGGRTGTEVNKGWWFANNTFRNLTQDGYSYLHFASLGLGEPAVDFTFEYNTVDGSTYANAAALNISSVSGEVVINGNVIANLLYRPFNIQVANNDGIDDTVEITDNKFISNGNDIQVLTRVANGTDEVSIGIYDNIFKDDAAEAMKVTDDTQAAAIDLSHNYYGDAVTTIQYNGTSVTIRSDDAADLPYGEEDCFSYYTGLYTEGELIGEIDPSTLVEVRKAAAVCQIVETGVKYPTLQAAFAEAENGETIQMIADCDITFEAGSYISVAEGRTLIFDLNGQVMTVLATGGKNAYFIENAGNLTITDTGDRDPSGDFTGKILFDADPFWNYSPQDPGGYNSTAILNRHNGVLTIAGGWLQNFAYGDAAFVIENNAIGYVKGEETKLVIDDGIIIGGGTAVRVVDGFGPDGSYPQFASSSSVTINDGYIAGGYDAIYLMAGSGAEAGAAVCNLTVNGGYIFGYYESLDDGSAGQCMTNHNYIFNGGTFDGEILTSANLTINRGAYAGSTYGDASQEGDYSSLWVCKNRYGDNEVVIAGGTFDAPVHVLDYSDNRTPYRAVSGGLFMYDTYGESYELTSFVAEGYAVVENTDPDTSEDYPWAVQEKVAVAEVFDADGESLGTYQTLAEAVDAYEALEDKAGVVIVVLDVTAEKPAGWKIVQGDEIATLEVIPFETENDSGEKVYFETLQAAYNASKENGTIRIRGTGTYMMSVNTQANGKKTALLDIGSATLNYDAYNLGGTSSVLVSPWDVATVNIGHNGKLAIVTGYGQSASTYCNSAFTSADATAVLQYTTYGNRLFGDNSGFKGMMIVDANVPVSICSDKSLVKNIEINGSLAIDCDLTMADDSVVTGSGNITVNRDKDVTLNGDFTGYAGTFGGHCNQGDGIMRFAAAATFPETGIAITGSQPDWPNNNLTARFEIDPTYGGIINASSGRIFLNGNTTAKLGGAATGNRRYVFGSYGAETSGNLTHALTTENVIGTFGAIENALYDLTVVGQGQQLTGDATVSLTGVDFTGDGYHGVYGAGSGATVGGDVNVTMNSGKGKQVAGALNAGITGETKITVNGGDLSNLFGIENPVAAGSGDITLVINGGSVGNVYGAQLQSGEAHGATVGQVGDVTVSVIGGTVTGGVRGGNRSAVNGIDWTGYRADSVTINLGGGEGTATINATVYGTSSLGVDGDLTVNVKDGAVVSKDIYAGSKYASTTGKTIVNVTGGSVSGKIYGGSAGSDGSSAAAEVNVSGGTVTGTIYANGSSGDTISGNATVSVSGGAVNDLAVDAGTVNGQTIASVTGGSVNGNITGFDSVSLDAALTMGAGKIVSCGAFSNAKAVTMTPQCGVAAIAFTTTFANTGSLTFDLTGATAESIVLVDNAGSATMTLADYGTVTLTCEGYVLKVVDNDLCATLPQAEEEIDVPTDESGEAVIPVKVPGEIFEQKEGQEIKGKDGQPLPAPTTKEEKQQFLVTEQPNGLKVWQNVAMGVDGNTAENALATISREPTAEEKAEAEKAGKTIDIVINTPISEFDPPTTTGVTVSYKLLRSIDGGKVWTVVAENLEKPEFPAWTQDNSQDALISEGDTLWKFQAVFDSQANAEAE